MTKLETYKCDRCGKHFDVPEDAEIGDELHVVYLDEEAYDLCEDCFSTIYWCIVNKKIDKVIEEILEKEEEKEEVK